MNNLMLITGKEDFFQNKLLVDNFKFYYYYQGVSRSLTLTGRRPVTSPRAAAVGSQGGKKSLQARFFAAASPASSALAGFPPKRLTQPTCSYKASYETI
jgi:hypothetical protein